MAEPIFIGGISLARLLLFLFVFVLVLVFGNAVYSLIRRSFDQRISKRSSKWFARSFQYLILGGGFYLSIYKILKLDLTAMAASLGVLGIVIALSSQQILQNILAGVLIFIQRPVSLEDWVSVGFPDTGINRVKDIRLTKTTLEDKDGRIIYVPNSILVTSKIINYTRMSFIEMPVELKVPYNKLEKAKKLIFATISENVRILPQVSADERSIVRKLLKIKSSQKIPEEKFVPRILLTGISDSIATISVRVWVREIQYKEVIISEFLSSLAKKMKKEKIW
ncbi:MAG: mechanosensitive ion channel domain-containing protein [Candidatus Woesearchaeota archaeon]